MIDRLIDRLFSALSEQVRTKNSTIPNPSGLVLGCLGEARPTHRYNAESDSTAVVVVVPYHMVVVSVNI